jgi:hypothetical protein
MPDCYQIKTSKKHHQQQQQQQQQQHIFRYKID